MKKTKNMTLARMAFWQTGLQLCSQTVDIDSSVLIANRRIELSETTKKTYSVSFKTASIF